MILKLYLIVHYQQESLDSQLTNYAYLDYFILPLSSNLELQATKSVWYFTTESIQTEPRSFERKLADYYTMYLSVVVVLSFHLILYNR